MPNVSLDELLGRIPSKFNLVMVVAKRARQIKDGAPRMVATQSVNPVTAAMEEVIAGKLVLDGAVAHLVDDFGQPIRTAPDRLEELLGLAEDEDRAADDGIESQKLSALDAGDGTQAEFDSTAHEPALIPDVDSIPPRDENSKEMPASDDGAGE